MIMDELLIKYLLGETTPDETARVGQWLSANAANQARYEQFKAAWEISERNPVPVVPDAQQALQRLKLQLHARQAGSADNNLNGHVAANPRPLYQSFLNRRAAAIFAAVVCAGIVTYLLTRRPQVQPPVAVVNTVPVSPIAREPKRETPPAMQTIIAGNRPRIDTLPDGSVVTLQQKASIAYPAGLNGNTRSIRLRGDAFFSVVHDAARPFVVQANDVMVTVIGTSFNIRSIPGHTEVRVKTGAVKVEHGTEAHLLHAGEKIAFITASQTVPDTSVVPQKHKQVQKSNMPDSAGIHRVKKQASQNSIPDSLRLHSKKKVFPGISNATVEAHKNIVRGIIDDLIKRNIVADKDHLGWFALDVRQFVVDGKNMPDSLHRAFVAGHIQGDSLGYYYGPNQAYGSGICFDKKDLY
jgi:transmembrane sensor